MAGRATLFAAVVVAVAALLISKSMFVGDSSPVPPRFTRVGRNNTVLFFTNDDYGLSNIHLATVSSMLVNQPDIEIHYSSFPRWKKRITQIEEGATKRTGIKKSVVFHPLPQVGFKEALDRFENAAEDALHRPGLESVGFWASTMDRSNMPWERDEYLDIYEAAKRVVQDVDPSLVVFETSMPPTLHAVRDMDWRHAILSPNSLKDAAGLSQANGEVLWKYPGIGTAFAYPVPWHQIPINIYVMMSIFYHLVTSPRFTATKAWLAERGISSPVRLDQVVQPDVPCIIQGTAETDYPFPIIPDNLRMTGPIWLSSAPAAEQDPELTSWLAQRPTVMINLGSHVDYGQNSTRAMVQAIRAVFDVRSDVQFLWKYNLRKDGVVQDFQNNQDEFPRDLFAPLAAEIANGHMKLVHWITAEPSALLETGHIVVTVHHGGANCFYEGIGMGIPHIVLPTWADCFDMAVKTEYLGIGVFGAKNSGPYWDGDELAASFLEVLGYHDKALTIQKKAKELAGHFKTLGRDNAAAEVAKLARLPSPA